MSCVEWYNLSLPFPVSCYTVGTHSRCLRVWERALGEMDGFFHEVKVIRTHRGPTSKGESEKKNKKFSYFMARWLRLDGTRIDGDGATVAASLIILPKVVEKQS